MDWVADTYNDNTSLVDELAEPQKLHSHRNTNTIFHITAKPILPAVGYCIRSLFPPSRWATAAGLSQPIVVLAILDRSAAELQLLG